MKRTIKITFQILVVILITVLLASLVTGGLILFRSLGTNGNFTHLIVLGTKVEGTEPSPMLSDRIKAAAKYLENNPDIICVVTGGKGDDENISEAQCMFNELTALGIDPSRILMEDQATSTVENFHFSVALLEDELGHCPTTLGVLSSEFHLLRANMIAKDLGIDAVTVAAHTSDAEAFITYFLREIFMVWYDGLKIALT